MSDTLMFKGLPTWFRANAFSARNQVQLAPGVYANWSDPGYHLGLHWGDHVDEDVADQAYEALKDVREDDVEAALAFVQSYLPRFLRVVPARRRLKFAEGFLKGSLR
jgi:hypothetical protein